jgi:predicted enzyme related to lactoylglutathione lyase
VTDPLHHEGSSGFLCAYARTAEFAGGARSLLPQTLLASGAFMPSTIRPIIVTNDLDRLLAFYRELLGAEEVMRFPEDGPVFYVGLTLDDSELGLTSDASVVPGEPGRMLLSIEVPDVDALLPTVVGMGGTVTGGPTDMPWGQRVAHIKDPDGNVVNLTREL